jgi:iron(III) transport system substrate-binding protein
VLWVNTPNLDTTHKAVWEAFNKRYGMNVQWEWLSLHATEASTRVRTEAQAGRTSADVIYGSVDNMKPVADAGLLDPYDWSGAFGSEFPGIQEAVDRLPPEVRGRAVAHWDVTYGIVYNTDLLKAAEVPSKIEELADPKWRGKLILNAAGAAPLDVLGLAWGKERITDLTSKLLENRPVLKRGSPAAVAAIAAGEGPIGLGSITQVGTQKKQGAPVEWRPFEVVPVLPQSLYVPNNATHPNLARLFTAWLVTEGIKIEEELESVGRISDPNSTVYKVVKELAPNAQIVQPTTIEQVQQQNAIGEAVGALIANPR